MSISALETHQIDHPTEHLKQDLSTQVEGALWRFDPIRQTNTVIQVTEDAGTIYLDGNIRGEMMKSIATRIAKGIPGVERVVNRLISDPEIERAAAMAVAMDEEAQTTTDKVAVASQTGLVVLTGRVFADAQEDADALRERIESLVREVEGVKDVSNQIEAIEGDEDQFVVVADAVEDDAGAEKTVGPKRMGTLLTDELKDKLRTMIKAREASRA